jgi:hypothetical protein
VTQTDTPTQTEETAQTNGSTEAKAGKAKAVAVAAGAGAAVAGIAGGIAVAARDTKRSGMQQTASTVVDRIQEPVRRVGSRFSRD